MKHATKTRNRRSVKNKVVRSRRPIRLRGLLPTPAEVAELVEKEVKRLPMTAAARQRVTDGFNLQYYFGGEVVATRATRRGVEVLAVGWDEISNLLRRATEDEQERILIEHPDPW